MRELTSHQVNDANRQLRVEVLDEAGSGGASHLYRIRGFSGAGNPSRPRDIPADLTGCTLLFQNGPILEAGVNGITHEALLAVLIDRLEGFQRGPFVSEYNEIALSYLRDTLRVLQKRTAERKGRGVEGTHAI